MKLLCRRKLQEPNIALRYDAVYDLVAIDSASIWRAERLHARGTRCIQAAVDDVPTNPMCLAEALEAVRRTCGIDGSDRVQGRSRPRRGLA